MLSFFQYLQSIHPISAEAQAALLGCIKEKELRKGQVWLQEGSVCDKFCFIDKGIAKVYGDCGSKEVAVWCYKEGELLLSAHSYFTQAPSRFAIRTVEACSVVYIMYQDMSRLLVRHIELNIHLRLIWEKYFAAAESRVGLLLRSPRERFDGAGELQPWIADGSRVSDRMLAAYVGVTPAAVSYYRTGRRSR